MRGAIKCNTRLFDKSARLTLTSFADCRRIAPVRIFLMSKPPEKPISFITGHKDGPPTLDQLIALTKRLTGRDPTPQEIEEARSHLINPATG
jgi:hypothetical protein